MKVIICFFFFLICSGCSTSNYFLVRHAEKVDSSRDPDLSEKGKNRALILKDSLLDKKINKLYATQFKRTQQTVRPLANALDKEIIIYDAGSSLDIVENLKKNKNENIVVAGHSNTVPEMILLLTGDSVHIGHDDYHYLFLVQKKSTFFGKKYDLRIKKYGPE
ncbi:MAG: phosphoglycerate mutase family protein [Bacteroidota bacterium]